MPKEHSELRLLSKSAAAAKLGIGKSTLNKLIEEGRIKVTYVCNRIRIPMKELHRFLDENSLSLSDLESQNISHPRYRIRRKKHIPQMNSQLTGESETDKIFNKLKMEVNSGIGL